MRYITEHHKPQREELVQGFLNYPLTIKEMLAKADEFAVEDSIEMFSM